MHFNMIHHISLHVGSLIISIFVGVLSIAPFKRHDTTRLNYLIRVSCICPWDMDWQIFLEVSPSPLFVQAKSIHASSAPSQS